jgi:hypothetical protein
MDVLKLRSAPRIRNMFMSAVELLTAVGVLDTLMPRFVQEGTSIWSYPAPVLEMVSYM